MSAFELIICVLLVCGSAYLSGSEIALFSLSRFQLRSLKERFRGPHRKIKKLLSDPGGLLMTILIINEVFNIAISSIITEAVAEAPKPEFFSNLPLPLWAINTILGTLAATPVILFLCEITPKVVAARANRLIAPLTAGNLTIIYNLFKPVRWCLRLIVGRILKQDAVATIHGMPTNAGAVSDKLLRESDFLIMLEEGHKEGAIQQGELQLIKNVLELDDITVGDVYTPLNQAQTLLETATVKTALSLMRGQRYSRIPVVSANSNSGRKQVQGVLYSKDLLRAKLEPDWLNQPVSTLMRKPLFVLPSMRLNLVFRKFKQQKTHMGVVQSPTGDALGVVTMSDVLESLFEDFIDENEEALD